MSSCSADLSIETLPLVGVASDVEAQGSRKDIGNYRIVRTLLRSAIAPTDKEALDAEGGAFRVHDSYDSLLWISDDLPLILNFVFFV